MKNVWTIIKNWFRSDLPDAKVQTGEQVTALIKNNKGKKTWIRTK